LSRSSWPEISFERIGSGWGGGGCMVRPTFRVESGQELYIYQGRYIDSIRQSDLLVLYIGYSIGYKACA
jgi:hypothetical protein